MIRQQAIPLIENAIATGVWRKYMSPPMWEYPVNFPDTLLEMFADAMPDFMDRMQVLASRVKNAVDNCPIELIHVPTSPNALMGQIEFIVSEPVKVTIGIVFYKGEIWVQEKEFFPFEDEPESNETGASDSTGRTNIASQIHFYDVENTIPDKGWLHYTSRVRGWEGVDVRVADVVRSLEDISFETVGVIGDTMPTNRWSPQIIRLLAEEAVRVSKCGPTWLDRIMTRSPLRDNESWRSEEKAKYLEQRRQRRKKFENGTLVFVKPNAKPTH
jgi:hypothetical protein